MHRIAAALLLAALPASTGIAQTLDWGQAQMVDVQLSSFKFTPATLTLHHGTPYRLHLTNTSSGGHDFAAKEFFAASQIAPEDRARLKGGSSIELDGGESADVRLVPTKPGTYPIHCTHFMHSSFGMTGKVVVD